MGIALITGASAGFGVEFARLFARDGHSVILVSRREDRLKELASELSDKIKVWIIAMDLGTPGAGQELFSQVQKLGLQVDFLVNNAGFGAGGALAQVTLPRQLEMCDLNMRTLLELTRLFLPAMLERGSGRILNVGSTAGFQPGPYMATYYASKAFVNSLSEALHQELLGTGVTCTLLAPGATATEFSTVAQVQKSELFKKVPQRSAAQVVATGYRAMMKGQAIAIPGLTNRLFLQSLRVSPRALVRRLVARLNRA